MSTNRLFILLLFLKVGIIVSDEDKCSSIEHCAKCPNSVCEICETGYKLTLEKKCIESKSSTASSKKSSSAAASSHKSSASSAAASSHKSGSGSATTSSHKSGSG